MTEPDRRAVATWLLVCAALVFAIVVVGGITRLTESGLSIVEWQPIVGVLPPLSQADWKPCSPSTRPRRSTRKVFNEIGLEGFKRIFWWEYIHRVIARVIGLVFLLPFLYFWIRGKLSQPLTLKLLGLFVLAACRARWAGTWSRAASSTIRA